MKFLILGDVHSEWSDMNVTIATAVREHPDITHIVQVGDFGYGWRGTKPFKASKAYFSDEEKKVYDDAEKLWLDGNHENFTKLEEDGGEWQPGWTHMSRGSILEVDGYRIMFFGGAASIDKTDRMEGVSWWRQENITYGQVQETLASVDGTIDALFTHDHASRIPYSDSRSKRDHSESNGNRGLLDVIVERFMPSFCFFGHHHRGDYGMVGQMEWTCCPIIEDRTYTIWTGYSVQRSWK